MDQFSLDSALKKARSARAERERIIREDSRLVYRLLEIGAETRFVSRRLVRGAVVALTTNPLHYRCVRAQVVRLQRHLRSARLHLAAAMAPPSPTKQAGEEDLGEEEVTTLTKLQFLERELARLREEMAAHSQTQQAPPSPSPSVATSVMDSPVEDDFAAAVAAAAARARGGASSPAPFSDCGSSFSQSLAAAEDPPVDDFAAAVAAAAARSRAVSDAPSLSYSVASEESPESPDDGDDFMAAVAAAAARAGAQQPAEEEEDEEDDDFMAAVAAAAARAGAQQPAEEEEEEEDDDFMAAVAAAAARAGAQQPAQEEEEEEPDFMAAVAAAAARAGAQQPAQEEEEDEEDEEEPDFMAAVAAAAARARARSEPPARAERPSMVDLVKQGQSQTLRKTCEGTPQRRPSIVDLVQQGQSQALRKTNVRRSPGGTPAKVEDAREEHHDSPTGGDAGSTADVLRRALRTKFANVRRASTSPQRQRPTASSSRRSTILLPRALCTPTKEPAAQDVEEHEWDNDNDENLSANAVVQVVSPTTEV